MISEYFEWDDEKAASNLKKHGVSFDTASLVFFDPLVFTLDHPDHSEGEFRFVAVGTTPTRALLVVGYVYRGPRIRILNARHATMKERRRYMNEDFDRISDVDDLRPEYDFSKGVRGKHYLGRTVMVRLEKDVAAVFSTGQEVNEALRQLIAEGRVPQTPATE